MVSLLVKIAHQALYAAKDFHPPPPPPLGDMLRPSYM